MSRQRLFGLVLSAAVVCGAVFAWGWRGQRRSAATFEQALAGAARGDGEAEDSDPQALCQLARIDRGDAGGEYVLAYLYSHGAAERDYSQAARWALKAAVQGDARAQSYLGGAYWRGDEVTRDSAEAARWFGRAADQGDRAASLFLATAYWRGEGVSRNHFEAAYHFAKVLGPTALRVLRRHGWTMYGGLLLLIAGAFAPTRLWGCPEWLSLGAISMGAGMLLFELISRSFCSGVWRSIAICFFGAVAIAYGTGAVQGAVRLRGGRLHSKRLRVEREKKKAPAPSPGRRWTLMA